MNHAPISRIIVSTIAAVLVVQSHVNGQTSANLTNAKALLLQSKAAYQSLAAIHLTVESNFAGGMTGSPQAAPSRGLRQTIDIRLQRPNKVRIEGTMITGRESPHRYLLVCDGRTIWDWSSDSNTYTKSPAPTNLRDISAPFPVYSLPGMSFLLGEDTVYRDLRQKTGKLPKGGVLQEGTYGGQPLLVGPRTQFAGVEYDVLEHKLDLGGRVRVTTQLYIARIDHLFRGTVVESVATEANVKRAAYRNETSYPTVDLSPRFTKADFTINLELGYIRCPVVMRCL